VGENGKKKNQGFEVERRGPVHEKLVLNNHVRPRVRKKASRGGRRNGSRESKENGGVSLGKKGELQNGTAEQKTKPPPKKKKQKGRGQKLKDRPKKMHA